MNSIRISLFFLICMVSLSSATPNITTLPATNVLSNSVTLNGNLTNLSTGSSGSIYFEYGGSSSVYLFSTSPKSTSTNGSVFDTLSGLPLLSNTKYYYRAVANISNNVYYGNQTSFTTTGITVISDYGFSRCFNASNITLDFDSLSTAATCPYTNLMGTVFWGFIFSIVFGMMWVRMEDITIPSLVGLIIGGSLWYLMPPEWVSVAMSLTVVSFGGLIYSLIKGR